MHVKLAALAKKQRGVFRWQQAERCGYSTVDVKRLIRTGVWTKVRHGIYTAEPYDPRTVALDRRTHLLAGAARMLAVRGDTLLSHESAALFHQLTLLHPAPAEPRLTRHRPDGSGRLTAHGLYVARVPKQHRHPGGLVTTAARTVVDCARCLDRDAGFVTAESALSLGLARLALIDVLDACHGWPGSAEARELIVLAGPWSESPLESRARLWFRQQGLPQPDQQRWITRLDGRFVGRVDFLWEQFRTVCETDGQVKYEDPAMAATADKPERGVVWREKLREDTLRDLGLEVVRGYWSDGEDDGAKLAERLRRAFARGLRAQDEPAYRFIRHELSPYQPLAVGG